MMRTTASLCALFAASAFAVNPIVVQEQEFVDSKTNERFVIIGVDYQPGGQGEYGTGQGDPLSNGTICLRDAALMQPLGVNTIRSYNVDPTLNHDECASIFNSVGIYMLLDVNSPLAGESIDRSDPGSSYDSNYLSHIFSVVESFKNYPNTLGFFAGNEVINDPATAMANPPYIRAVQRDLKNYIAKHAPRTIPVGYSAAQVQDVLHDSWAYLQCNNNQDGSEDMSRSDFFGLNSYSWCGSGSSFETSGYNQLVEWFTPSTIPVFFSEYGCNQPMPRVFDEVTTLYGPKMTALSGGLVYEWTQETDMYGLVQQNSNGSLSLLPDYNTLHAQYLKLDLSLITSQNKTSTNLDPPACNVNLITSDSFSHDFNIPDAPPGADDLIANGVSMARKGAMVSVTQTQVQIPVLATNGAELKGLHIRMGDSQNLPSTSTLGGSDDNPTGSPATSPSTGFAARKTPAAVYGGSAAAAAILGLAAVL